MQRLHFVQDPRVPEKLAGYPEPIRPLMLNLRRLILDVADNLEDVRSLEETLKWGEPSYLTKRGSTLRMDWKEKTPDQYAMYFKCTSTLVPTFRTIYGDLFRYEKNRAIVFGLDDPVPEAELKVCIGMALRYHVLKELPLLGYVGTLER